MRMNQKGALIAGAVMTVAFLAACSDSTTAPTSRAAFIPKSSSFAVGDVTNNTAVIGQLKICKTGNANGTFVTADIGDGQGGTGAPTISSPLAVATGECRIAAIDNGDANALKGDFFSVTENAAANTVQTLTSCLGIGQVAIACNNNYFVNNVHGVVLTYNNVFTPPPPPPTCVFTKGWYRNNGENTITLTIDGRTPNQQRAIFDAKPGQPGGVTFGGDNTLLNLYQQLLAALNNLGGNALGGPPAVDVAIAAALAGTGGTNLNITTTLNQTDMSALIDVLSNFNEGQFAGFPHCDD